MTSSDSPTGYDTIYCRTCGGVAHPATGCVYSPTFIVCWRCTLEFAAWLENWTNGKGRRRGPAFYAHVGRITT